MNDNPNDSQQNGRLNGKHVTAIFVVFFGVVAAVNFTMARFATSGFSGTVVDNSYVASQKFNGWLAKAETQQKLGWTVSAKRDEGGYLLVSANEGEAPIENLSIQAEITNPLGVAERHKITLAAQPDGIFKSENALPKGRWQLHLLLTRKGDDARYQLELP